MNGPLDGIRVLDLSRVLAGPYCTMILGDLGAEVIKVERPGRGDDLRSWGPPFGPTGDSTYYLGVNRNKRSISLDLGSEAGKATLRELAADADVVVENFRAGTLERLGLGLGRLREDNPRLVTCSISGYGSEGPWETRPGYDVMIQAMSGLMSVTGEPDGQPMRVGVAIVDLSTGMYAATGITAALQARATSGRGQHVDLSLLEASLALLPNLTTGYLVAGDVPQRLGTRHPSATPYGVFATEDAHIVIAIGNDGQWRKLCQALDHPEVGEDPRLAGMGDRIAHRDEVEGMVTEWCATWSTAALTERLGAFDVPAGPVHTVPEILVHEQVEALGVVQPFPIDDESTAPLVRSPLRFSADPRRNHLAPPGLGADTEAILADLGWSPERITEQRAAGAFGAGDDGTDVGP